MASYFAANSVLATRAVIRAGAGGSLTYESREQLVEPSIAAGCRYEHTGAGGAAAAAGVAADVPNPASCKVRSAAPANSCTHKRGALSPHSPNSPTAGTCTVGGFSCTNGTPLLCTATAHPVWESPCSVRRRGAAVPPHASAPHAALACAPARHQLRRAAPACSPPPTPSTARAAADGPSPQGGHNEAVRHRRRGHGGGGVAHLLQRVGQLDQGQGRLMAAAAHPGQQCPTIGGRAHACGPQGKRGPSPHAQHQFTVPARKRHRRYPAAAASPAMQQRA